MDKKYLNKVIDQLVNETELDHDREIIIMKSFPIPNWPEGFFTTTFLFFGEVNPRYPVFEGTTHRYFSIRCKEIYGLNDDEANYVWGEYKRIINDKIK